MSRQEDDGQLWTRRDDALAELEAVHPSHPEVGDHDIDDARFERLERLVRRAHRRRSEPAGRELGPQEVAHALVVIDDEHMGTRGIVVTSHPFKCRPAPAPRHGPPAPARGFATGAGLSRAFGGTMSGPSERPQLTVLVADDDEDLRSLVVEALRADGYRVIEAHDGAELLDHLRAGLTDSAPHPDVVVTDVLMPKLSGLGVLDALRRAQWNVPVILMTVMGDGSVHTLARRLGAVRVLRKPLDIDDLRTAVLDAGVAFAGQRSGRLA
jgi:CheY-like chemotaxis protein